MFALKASLGMPPDPEADIRCVGFVIGAIMSFDARTSYQAIANGNNFRLFGKGQPPPETR
jgi:hypothetical protein